MKIDEKLAEHKIIYAPRQSLTVRSAALVARGLRDLARNSNWLTRKVFAGHSPQIAISPSGKVCVKLQHVGTGSQRVTVYDIEGSNLSPIEFSASGESPQTTPDSRAAFVWSPTSRYLVGATGAWRPELHLFDVDSNLNKGMHLSRFGGYSTFPNSLTWSDAGGFFASASGGGKKASLRLWTIPGKDAPVSDPPASTLGTLAGVERQTYEAEFGEEGALLGYGKTVFSPDEKSLSVILEFKGDWADDSILIADVPSLKDRSVFQAQGHITDLSWTLDGQHVIYCAGSQAFRLSIGTMTSEEMRFGAELCVCHPFLPLCACFSSWLKDSAKGRVAIFDLSREEMFDECAAENIVALRWSGDGSKAYAMTEDGLAYVYESPVV